MVSRQLARRPVLMLVSLLILVALACNAPLTGDEATVVPSEEEREATPAAPTATLGAPETLPPDLESEEGETDEQQLTATDTPPAQPTLRPTTDASPTPRPLPTRTPTPRSSAPTATSGPSNSGPLDFDYNISWRLAPGNPLQAIATVEIRATGGGGGYEYYRDELPVDGPIFEYQWASCKSNPGSLRVDSADGQSVRKNYSVEPPCPTPTPTASP